MAQLRLLRPPGDLDWQIWVDRWDRMQQRHRVRRSERLEMVVRTVACEVVDPIPDFRSKRGVSLLTTRRIQR